MPGTPFNTRRTRRSFHPLWGPGRQMPVSAGNAVNEAESGVGPDASRVRSGKWMAFRESLPG
jgi:hypothetical protein